jgi:uncharacterized membrane protein YoaK (UPF0700 family)
MDAISFLAFGVFTSAMSGNTIVLGIAIGQHAWGLGINAGLALIAYMLGAAASSCVSGDSTNPRRGLALLIFGQMILLVALAAIWLTHETTLQRSDVRFVLIVLAALAMGVQATAAQSLRLSGIITVVFTGTLTAIARAVAERLLRRSRALSDDTKRQITSWACYGAGAIIAAAVQVRTGAAALVPMVTSGAALMATCRYKSSGEGSHST